MKCSLKGFFSFSVAWFAAFSHFNGDSEGAGFGTNAQILTDKLLTGATADQSSLFAAGWDASLAIDNTFNANALYNGGILCSSTGV